MIDINRIRNNKEEIEKALLKRMDDVNLDDLLAWDKEKRKLGTKLDEYKSKRNKVSKDIAVLKREGKDPSDLIDKMQTLGKKIDKGMIKYHKLEEKVFNYLAGLPNVPDVDVPAGGKENNIVLSTYLDKPKFDFDLIPHYELLKDLDMVDYERGIKLAGEKNWIYKGVGAKLEWALINYFIDTHNKNGYEFLMIPYMLKNECGFGAGQFPKFNDEVYMVSKAIDINKHNNFLLPTAETGLVNIHSNEIMDEKDLPKKYFTYTQCFRVEAGSSREEERGTIRGHQFNKVELVQYVTYENTKKAFNELLKIAEDLMQSLGLHYRVSKLAGKDCSGAMARTYDIEVWIPSMGIYKEVSSVSSSYDYQARRNNTKYRDKDGKLHFVCTLNGSALATSRLVPAIVEQFQNKDGSITIPEVLRPYMGGLKTIK